MTIIRRIKFWGNSRKVLQQFPEAARSKAGYQLNRVQQGMDPFDWKPMNKIGAGVREIRVQEQSGIFRIMYVAKFADAIYVLHCFQKKTQKTSSADLETAMRHYKEVEREYSQ